MINIDDFAKVEMKAGVILEAEEIEGSEKLLKLSVDFAEENPRQVLSGIKQWYKPEDLKGNAYIFVTNLEPRTMMGLESQAMIMAADGEDGVVLLIPSKSLKAGSPVR